MAALERPNVRRVLLAAAVFSVLGFTFAGGMPCSVLAAQPACNVVISPGPTPDVLASVTVNGADTFPPAPDSELAMATIAVTERISWRDYFGARRSVRDDVTLRTTVFPPGETRADTQARNTAAMRESQRNAEQAAYRHLNGGRAPRTVGVEILTHTTRSVLAELPAGAVITHLNDTPVTNVAEFTRRINATTPNARVTVKTRDGHTQTFPMPDGDAVGRLGVYVADAVDLPFVVTVDSGVVGGPSAGLLFAVAIVEQLQEGAQIGSHNVSGTGTLNAQGEVGPVGGIHQKVFAAGARDSTVDVFFLPEANAHQLTRLTVERELLVIPVASLAETLTALAELNRGETPADAVWLQP